ncbi:hypothetical protein KC644_03400 [Candidatus Berkelbacteria bacterium]|nr:hypothetical protein [Candidatus Berkelbacteria bacterium]
MNLGGNQSSQKGTALLIAMVLVAVIGTIAFAIGRVSLSSFTQVVRLEDSLNAYSAATAGIEDGLLRFRFNKDIETPTSCDGSDSTPTRSSQLVTRVNLSQPNTSPVCVNPLGNTPSPGDIIYDLKISHKLEPGEPEVQNTKTTSRGTIVALAHDQAIEYDVSDLTKPIQISWEYENPGSLSPNNTNSVEISLLDSGGGLVSQDSSAKKLIKENSGAPNSATFPITGIRPDIIRIRAYNSNLSSYRIQSLGGEPLSSRTTFIEVTGYYGRSKRKLELSLDRISGSILELFDFVLFSGSGDVSGPNP